MAKRDLISEIVDYRSRNGSARMQGILPAVQGLFHLVPLLERMPPAQKAQRDHLAMLLPVRMVAILQSYYRRVFADLIDSEDRYLENAGGFQDIKLKVEYLVHLKSRKLSPGELIAHHLQVNSIDDLFSYGGKIVGRDVKELLSSQTVTLGNGVKWGLSDPKEYAAFWKDLYSLFDLRHRFCHEAALDSVFDLKVAHRILRAVSMLLLLTEEAMKGQPS